MAKCSNCKGEGHNKQTCPNYEEKLPTIRNYDIVDPGQMANMADVLKEYVVKQGLYSPIQGKNYVNVEGWQFAGGLLGLYPRVTEVYDLSNDQEVKWRADVELVRLKDDTVVGRGFALCSNKERTKKNFDEYAILSMAQTRAVGKAYRNLVGWVMKMAGYESTPKEEVDSVEEVQKKAPVVEAECHECGNPMSKAASEFSIKIFKKSLCRTCQESYSTTAKSS